MGILGHGMRDRLERPTGLTAHRGRITRRAGARLVVAQAAEDARGTSVKRGADPRAGRASQPGGRPMVAQPRAAGRVAQDTQRASAWRPRDARAWSAWSAGLQHAPASVSRATPGESRGTRLHAPWPGVGHSHSERGTRLPGAHPQRGGGVLAGQRVGAERARVYRPRRWWDWHATCLCQGEDPFHDHRSHRGHAHEEHRVRNRTTSLHSLFSLSWLGSV